MIAVGGKVLLENHRASRQQLPEGSTKSGSGLFAQHKPEPEIDGIDERTSPPKTIVIFNYVYKTLLEQINSHARNDADYRVDEQLKKLRFASDFAIAAELSALGWSTRVVPVNSTLFWASWFNQHQTRKSSSKILSEVLRIIARFKIISLPSWCWSFLVAEMAVLDEIDIVYGGHPKVFSSRTLGRLKRFGGMAVLNHSASTVPPRILTRLDGFTSCVRFLANEAQEMGTPSLHLRHGFDARSLSVERVSRDLDVVFVGSVDPVVHGNTLEILRQVSRVAPGLRIFSPSDNPFKNDLELMPLYCGPAWGMEMLGIYARAKVVINRHGLSPGAEAANMRLFEATGCGAALVTDDRRYLGEIFEIDQEVLVYRSPEEAASKVELLLNDEELRKRLAGEGRMKVLDRHTLAHRARELSDFLSALLPRTVG